MPCSARNNLGHSFFRGWTNQKRPSAAPPARFIFQGPFDHFLLLFLCLISVSRFQNSVLTLRTYVRASFYFLCGQWCLIKRISKISGSLYEESFFIAEPFTNCSSWPLFFFYLEVLFLCRIKPFFSWTKCRWWIVLSGLTLCENEMTTSENLQSSSRLGNFWVYFLCWNGTFNNSDG